MKEPRTRYYYQTVSSSLYAILMAKVNPSQRAPFNSHKAWVVIRNEDGAVVVGYCLCMAG